MGIHITIFIFGLFNDAFSSSDTDLVDVAVTLLVFNPEVPGHVLSRSSAILLEVYHGFLQFLQTNAGPQLLASKYF
jgi:hypothetical protein